MKSTRNLRLRLRLMECALLLLLGVLTTAAISTHQLLLDAANHPTGPVDLADPHWTGTLDAARLPGSVPLLTPDGVLDVASLSTDGSAHFAGDRAEIDPSGNFNLLGDLDTNGAAYLDGGAVSTDGGGDLFCNVAYTTEFRDATGNYGLSPSYGLNVAGFNVIDAAGTGRFPGGVGMWGVAPPSSQPAAPTTLAEIVAVLRAYGLCQ